MTELNVPLINLPNVLTQPVEPLTNGELIGKDGVHLTPQCGRLLTIELLPL